MRLVGAECLGDILKIIGNVGIKIPFAQFFLYFMGDDCVIFNNQNPVNLTRPLPFRIAISIPFLESSYYAVIFKKYLGIITSINIGGSWPWEIKTLKICEN